MIHLCEYCHTTYEGDQDCPQCFLQMSQMEQAESEQIHRRVAELQAEIERLRGLVERARDVYAEGLSDGRRCGGVWFCSAEEEIRFQNTKWDQSLSKKEMEAALAAKEGER